ncbi:MAG: hypothetical protein AAF960_19470 [Bacteroidota bacterium]
MSEFQQYQFQTIDRPLTEAERQEVSSWSSRATASATSITFTYSYSDFPKDEDKVVAKYFDAMLYVANWGTKRLMFRFPKSLIDENAITEYSIYPEYAESYLTFSDSGEFLIMDMALNDDDGGGWMEEDDYRLSDFIPLREQIINGDYRCLIMAWLKVAQEDVEMEKDEYEEEEYEENPLPPIPSGLKKLNGPLTAFQNFFEIDDDILEDVVKKSPNLSTKKMDYTNLLAKLSVKEKDDFLLRLIDGEARLDIKLKKLLEKLG